MALEKVLCSAIVFIVYVWSSCSAVRCGSPQFKFSGFQAGLKSDASLSANSTVVLKGYTSLLDGIFAQEVTVAVLSGVVTLKHSGVYFFAASVHFITTLNDTCDGGSGTIKVAICADNDCKNKASLQAVSQTCDKAFSMTATGLLFLTSTQTLRVHLFNTGDSPLTIGAASMFSGYLLACTD